jgi:RNA polymerase sigma-70 factor (ECF subfamily)
MERHTHNVRHNRQITMKDENPDAEWIRSQIDAHAALLTRYAASIMGDVDGARDVVQDVFVRLWRAPRDKVDGQVRPWLFRVCRNRALDQRRKGGRMQALTREGETLRAVADEPGPGELAERHDSHARLLCLLRELPENQREVVRLKFQNGMSYKEIATVTRLSVSHVGVLLHTALGALRARVATAGE